MCIVENRVGIRLEEYFAVNEDFNLLDFNPLSGAYAIINVNGRMLLGYNKWRQQWEFPAGKIEAGEKPEDAARRELYEETHQQITDLSLCGIFKIYDSVKMEYRYRVMYYGELDRIVPFVASQSDEMEKIMLWDLCEEIGYIDEVDLKMVELGVIKNSNILKRGKRCCGHENFMLLKMRNLI